MIFFFLSLYRFIKFYAITLSVIKFKFLGARLTTLVSPNYTGYNRLFFKFLRRLLRLIGAYRALVMRCFLSNFLVLGVKFAKVFRLFRHFKRKPICRRVKRTKRLKKKRRYLMRRKLRLKLKVKIKARSRSRKSSYRGVLAFLSNYFGTFLLASAGSSPNVFFVYRSYIFFLIRMREALLYHFYKRLRVAIKLTLSTSLRYRRDFSRIIALKHNSRGLKKVIRRYKPIKSFLPLIAKRRVFGKFFLLYLNKFQNFGNYLSKRFDSRSKLRA